MILTNLLLAVAVGLLVWLGWRVAGLSRDLAAERAERGRRCEGIEQAIDKVADGLFGQLAVYRSLCDRLELHKGLPYSPRWSASPDFLELITDHCEAARPAVVLECSSGVTTLMLARCCAMHGQGRVVSLENGAPFAVKTRTYLDRYALGAVAQVVDAPLRDTVVDGRPFAWYALDDLPDVQVEMLVIDGPPGFIQAHSRFPAVPLLYDRLADGCVVFLDDAARADEQAIVARWQMLYPGLEVEYLATERGCVRLVVHRRAKA